MSAADVQAKVKSGLAKAKAKVGSIDSPIVYLKSITETGGTPGDPFDPPISTPALIELTNAIFKSVALSGIDGTLIQAGDMELICDGDTAFKAGDIITQAAISFIVITIGSSSPFGIALNYNPIVRQQ
jgi:hypothetical protein